MTTMWDPNHEPKHRADRDTDSPSLAAAVPPQHTSGLVVGKRRYSFLGDAYARHLSDLAAASWSARDLSRASERGSATAGAALILFMFATFLVGVGAFVRLVTQAQP